MSYKKLPSHYALPAIIISTLLVAIVISAWQEPTSPPPGGNASSSLTVGSVAQYREGPLRIGGVLQTDQATFLARWGGNVGIGTTSTEATLHVVSGNDGTLKIGTNSGTSAQLCLNGQCFTKTDLLAGGGGCSPLGYVGTFFQNGGKPHYCSQIVIDATGYVTTSNINNGLVCDSSNNCLNGLCAGGFWVPSQVMGLSAARSDAHQGYNKVVLSWSAPANNGAAITDYKIYRSTAPNAETYFINVGSAATSYTDTGLTMGTNYYYKVSAVNSVGEGTKSLEQSAISLSGTDHGGADWTMTNNAYGIHYNIGTFTVPAGIYNIKPFDGTADSGTLIVYAQNGVITGTLNADISGYGNGGNAGPGAGGTVRYGAGGGGYGNWGQNNCNMVSGAGIPYGSASDPAYMGSMGGSSPYGQAGGVGGGLIKLNILGTLTFSGTITSSGGSTLGTDAGGGSGGTVYLDAGTVSGSGSIVATGGDGGFVPGHDGGGGGAGGRVAVYQAGIHAFSGSVNVLGGRSQVGSGYGCANGGTGTYYSL